MFLLGRVHTTIPPTLKQPLKHTGEYLRTNGLVNQASDGYVFATCAAFGMVQIVGRIN